ncbi:M48 family metallopeptidase [Ruminococcus flavefaciens]|uniref:M48 family metallopeptidase n=1 Tax=Ruminococcus flavefaciens TaxID=1265 RepID=UPI0004671473|nr:SprT family zinc-dependent metalloprotease [Ruminococcus flavefaciens]
MKALSTEIRRVATPYGAMEYTLERKKVKNINLRVKESGEVYVSAPKRVPVGEIESFIISRSDNIRRAAEYYAERDMKKAQPSYENGSALMFLGRQLRLELMTDSREFIALWGMALEVHMKDTSDIQHAKELVEGWYERQCSDVFHDLIVKVHGKFLKYDVDLSQLKIRTMRSRWGSCNYTKGIITLNRRLIEAPRHCIEHVVTHEFCHFIHPNHSKDFYALLSAEFPDWKASKKELEKTVIL